MVLKFTFFQNCSSLFYISQNYIRRFKDTTVFEDVFTEILTQAIRHNLVSGADSIQENNLTHYQSKITLDDLQSKAQMKEHANKALHHTVCYNLNQIIKKEIAKLKQRTAW